jgi:putative membrane protein
MLDRLILQILAGILALWLAVKFVPGVEFEGKIQILLFAGLVLGLINYFIKPILKFITLPLRILTLGLFTLVINMFLIWLVDLFFKELKILGILPLFLTTIIVLILGFIFGLYRR